MKKTLCILALVSAPLAAQSFEAGVTYNWNPSRTQSVDIGGSSSDIKADTWKAAGLRFGYSFMSFGPAELQGTAAYQSKNEQDVLVNGSNSSTGAKEEYSYWALGASVNWNFLVRLGVGLEYRSERLHFHQSGGGFDSSTTYGRPWLRAHAGYVFPMPVVKPFIGLQMGLPLTSNSFSAQDLSNGDVDKLNKGIAPKAEYGVYAGLRF